MAHRVLQIAGLARGISILASLDTTLEDDPNASMEAHVGGGGGGRGWGGQGTLFDGSYHDVDSNENAFKMAASMAFKEGMRKASPVLLEPMMSVEVETPEDYTGTVMGDLSSRRGMVQGMDDMLGGGKSVKAEVPLSEMFGYSTSLRSATQGRATYTMEFKHYAEAPKNVAEAIMNKK